MSAERLKELWERGLPYSEIALRLGITRQAAKGKAWRLGLVRGEAARIEALKAWHQSNKVKAKLYVRPETQVSPALAAAVWPVTITSVGLRALKPGQCHWPVGEAEGVDQLFCGGQTVDHHRYCSDHVRLAFVVIKAGEEQTV